MGLAQRSVCLVMFVYLLLPEIDVSDVRVAKLPSRVIGLVQESDCDMLLHESTNLALLVGLSRIIDVAPWTIWHHASLAGLDRMCMCAEVIVR